MALITKRIMLDITPGAIPQTINVSQKDIGRAYEVTLIDEGGAFTIPAGTTAKVEGTIAAYPFSEDAVVSGNTISFQLTKAMTAVSGKAWTKIMLTKDDEPVSTCAFYLDVDRAGVTAKDIINAPGFEEQLDAAAQRYFASQELDVQSVNQKLDKLATFPSEEEPASFVNQIPISTDASGAVYNDTGYKTGYRLNSSGNEVEASAAGVTGFIPVTATDTLRFRDLDMISGNSSCCLVAYKSDKTFLRHLPAANLVTTTTDEDTGYILSVDLSGQTNISGIAFARVSAVGLDGDSIVTANEEIPDVITPEDTEVALNADVFVPQAEAVDQRVTALTARVAALESGEAESESVVNKYAGQIDRAMQFGYKFSTTGKTPLQFLHISDTHGSTNAENAVTILNKLYADGRCSFMIHTGDVHPSTFANVGQWNTFAGYIANANAPVLMVSGNHDVGNTSQNTTDGSTATDAQLYARMFEPYVSGWNLTSHPTGKCYWYKDFADSGVRLIGLYDFESNYETDSNNQLLYKRGYAAYRQAQIDWLIQALLTCPAGYGVIIAKHNPVNLRGTLDNPFNGEYLQGKNTGQTYVDKDIIPTIVQAFVDGTSINRTFAQESGVVTTLTVNQDFSGKNSGAHFVCYLDGHTHADGVSFLKDFPKQLELNIGADNYHYQHYADTYNQQGTLHEDLLNYVSVDVDNGYVYILRIGNDFTAQADRRDFTAIKYKD